MNTSAIALHQRMNRLAVAAVLMVTLAGWLGYGLFATAHVPPIAAGEASMIAGHAGHYDLQRPDVSRILTGPRSELGSDHPGDDVLTPPVLPLSAFALQAFEHSLGLSVRQAPAPAPLPPVRGPPHGF